jgi:hypothetical protein
LTPTRDEEGSECFHVDKPQIDVDPPEATDVGRARERFRIAVDEVRLGARRCLDRDAIAPITADREDFLPTRNVTSVPQVRTSAVSGRPSAIERTSSKPATPH